MEESICSLMMADHLLISNQIREINQQKDKPRETSELLSKLKWTLEKHFILEEHAVFDVLNNLQGMEVDETFELLRDHQQIMELIKNVEGGFKEGTEVNLERIKEMLEKHTEMEDVFFYPKLDKELNINTKSEIIRKIKEHIRG